jgi:glycosyltransferase involved in cell wall biosynthesis/Flp pilus assembly protein TadD
MPIRVSSKRAAAPARPTVSFELPAAPKDAPQKPAGLSLCMIVKNEERFLEQCLRSVKGIVDEICIVDTGSTDKTVEIARAFGARIEHREWRNDFAWARNEAIDMATRRWIIMLDADEELKPESGPALDALKSASAATTGVWIRCYNKSDDYRGTGDMSHALVRVFPNNERIRFRGMIHEFVTLDGSANGLPAVNAPISIVHHGYLKEVVESREKAKRNLEIVTAAAEADPTDAFNWFNLGSTAFMMQDYKTSLDAFERMRELNGDTPRGFIANGYAILAELYCDKLGEAIKGEEIARGALRFSPHYANAHFQLGKALVAQQRFEEARAAFLDAIEDGKYSHLQFVVDDQVSIWKAHSEIGSSFVMQGDDRSAEAWFRKGLENAPGVQPLMLNLARALERLAQYDESHELFRRVYEEFRDEFGTLDYVNFLLRRKDGAAALRIIDAVHESLSTHVAVKLLHAAAQISHQMSAPDQTLRYLTLAVERAPGNAEVLNWLESIYLARGDHDAVRRLIEREWATQPSTADDFIRRSYQQNVGENYDRGLALAEAGIALYDTNEHLHYNAAVAAAALSRLDVALRHVVRVETRESNVYVPSLILRAKILRSLSRNDEAVAAVENALAADASNAEAHLLKAQLAEERHDDMRAEAALQQLAQIDPQRGAVELAAFFLRKGRFDDAARVADAALQR